MDLWKINSVFTGCFLFKRSTGYAKTIFVVDDNGTNLSTAEEALEDKYKVLTFNSAARMFAALGKMIPDLILLDIEMPVMDGFEALKQLKENPQYKRIPVIFLTGTFDLETEEKATAMGAVGFIIKPFSPPMMLECIRKNLYE